MNLGSAAFIEPFCWKFWKERWRKCLVWRCILFYFFTLYFKQFGAFFRLRLRLQFRWKVTATSKVNEPAWSLYSLLLSTFFFFHRLITLSRSFVHRNLNFKSKIHFHRKQTTIYIHTRLTILRRVEKLHS